MVFATFPGPYAPEPLAERMSNRMLIYSSIYLSLSADPCLALAQAGRRPGSPQVCGFGLPGPGPAWSTRHQTLCHCLPKSPRTRYPAAAVLCQRLASRHTPFRGFHNLREARPITTQNPVCGPLPLWSPQTRCPAAAGLCQRLASRHTPFRGFQNVRRARSTAHHDTNPVCGPLPLCHCLPRSPQTRCPAAAALCQRLAMSPECHTPLHPFRGFHNLREARAIRTQNPRVGLYRFATAFAGHRPCRHNPFRGFQNVREALSIRTQNPSVGLYRFATAFPGHREHVALQQQSFASAWQVAILHLEGFKTCAKHGPSRHKTPLWAFTALPLPSQVTANTLPCSGSPLPAPGHVAILHWEGFKTCAKHGPSRHKTRLWAFTALPLPSQVTANTLPCSGRPLPAPGQLPYSIQRVSKRATCAKHGPSRHKPRLWAFTALPLPSQVTANTLPCSGSPLPALGHVARMPYSTPSI